MKLALRLAHLLWLRQNPTIGRAAGLSPLISGPFVLTKRSLILLLIIITSHGQLAADNRPVGYTWVLTDTVGPPKRPGEDFRELEVTPSVSTKVPNSQLFRNNAVNLFLRLREPTVAGASGCAFYGGRITIVYDVRALDDPILKPLTRAETRLVWENSNPSMKVSYYRGRLVYAESQWISDEWLTVVASADKKPLVAVRDSGPIDVSENRGLSWKTIDRPGQYEFTLATTPKGSSFVAVISIADKSQTLPARATNTSSGKNWYCTVSTADGSQLVVTGGPTSSAPALSITRSGTNSVLTWPASFTGFVLQGNIDLTTANWVTLTNRSEVVNGQNQVILPVVDDRTFFRLKTH
jgi:hypothetical protein